MRLHRNLVHAVVDALVEILDEGAPADRTIERVLRSDKRWGARDRAFIAETTYDVVRWKRLYAEIAEVTEPLGRESALRLISVWAILKGIPLPDWEEFRGTPERRYKGRFDALRTDRKVRESLPDWLDTLGATALGENLWTQEIAALNRQAEVVLRTNRLRTGPKALARSLATEGIATRTLEDLPDALVLTHRANVFGTQAFRDGWFEVQDASSQQVAPFLQTGPGMRVIDACAGAGGKTLHLANEMRNKGQLIAMDVHAYKLKELKRRARRNGVHNIEPRPIESPRTIKKLKSGADRVLLDVPCTGLGVLRRNPDTKWKLDPGFLDTVTDLQNDILRRYSGMLRPGGKLVYATCSILPRENGEQVTRFLESAEGKGFELEAERSLLASRDGFDGFYMARLLRKE